MSIARKIATNTAALLLSNGLGNAITLLTMLYLARMLGPSFYGEFALATAFISMFTIFSSPGTDTIITREIAKDETRKNELVNTTLILKTGFAALAIALANAAAYIIYPNNVLRLAIAIRSLLLLFSSFTATLTAVFHAKLQMIYPATANLLSKLIFPAMAVAIITGKGGYVQLITAATLPFIAETAALWLLSIKTAIKLRIQFSRETAKFLISQSWPIALSGVIYIIYTRTDMLMLSLLSNSESIGFYSAALNITEPIQFLTGSLMTVVFPILARFHATNQSGFYRTLGTTTKIAAITAAPITIAGTALSTSIIKTIYGSQYTASAPVFSILSAGAIFFAINIVLGNMLTAVNKQKLVTLVVAAGAALNAALDYALILKMGTAGAALATLIVLITTTIMLLALSIRTVKMRINITATAKITAAIAASAAAMIYLRENFLTATITGAVAYIIVILATKTFTKEEYKLAKEIISRKTQEAKW